MPKLGILHDYDIMANKEDSAQNQICAICGTENMTFQWSDYSGEAMCTQCGCPYQLKWGSEEQKKEDKYPYMTLRSDFLEKAKEYWNETHKFVCYGMMLGPTPGMRELVNWLKIHGPEFLEKNEDNE